MNDPLPIPETDPSRPASDDGIFGMRRKRHRGRRLSQNESIYDWIILSLLLLGPVVGAWLFGGVRLWSTGSLLFFTFIAAVLFGLRPFIFHAATRPFIPVALPVLALFLLYCAFTIPRAASPYDAAIYVVRGTGFALAYWMWTDLAGGHHHRWRKLISFLLLSASVMALYALIQHNRGTNMVLNLPRPDQYEMRASGAFMCPNHFASYIGLVLPIALALVLCRDSGPLLMIIGFYALTVIPPALYLTQSRSGWLGTLAGLVVTGVLLAARRSWRSFWTMLFIAPLFAAALAATAWYLSPMIQARVADAVQGNPRMQIWQDTLAMIRDAPLTGHGPGSYRWVYPKYWHELKGFVDPEHAHNETLQALAEYGPAGFALLAAGLLTASLVLLLRIRTAARDKDAALIAAALGAATTALVHSCFDYNLHVYSVPAALVLIFGLATSALFASETIKRRDWFGAKLRRAACILVILVGSILAVIIGRAVVSDLFRRSGDKARLNHNYEKSANAYAGALTCDARNYTAHLGLGHLFRTRATWEQDEKEKQNFITRSQQEYEKTLAINAAHLDARVSLALLQKLAGNSDLALQTMRDLVAYAPLHRDNLCRLGLMLREAGKKTEALEIFRRAEALGTTELIRLNLRDLTVPQ